MVELLTPTHFLILSCVLAATTVLMTTLFCIILVKYRRMKEAMWVGDNAADVASNHVPGAIEMTQFRSSSAEGSESQPPSKKRKKKKSDSSNTPSSSALTAAASSQAGGPTVYELASAPTFDPDESSHSKVKFQLSNPASSGNATRSFEESGTFPTMEPAQTQQGSSAYTEIELKTKPSSNTGPSTATVPENQQNTQQLTSASGAVGAAVDGVEGQSARAVDSYTEVTLKPRKVIVADDSGAAIVTIDEQDADDAVPPDIPLKISDSVITEGNGKSNDDAAAPPEIPLKTGESLMITEDSCEDNITCELTAAEVAAAGADGTGERAGPAGGCDRAPQMGEKSVSDAVEHTTTPSE